MSEEHNQEQEFRHMVRKLDIQDEGAVIDYAQETRHQLTEAMMNAAIGGDTKAGNLVRGLVGDMSKDIFTARKIQVEDKNADTNAALARQAAAIMDENKQQVKRHDYNPDDVASDEGPSFDTSEMPDVEIPDYLATRGTPDVDVDKIISDGLARSKGAQEDED